MTLSKRKKNESTEFGRLIFLFPSCFWIQQMQLTKGQFDLNIPEEDKEVAVIGTGFQ